MVWCKCGGFMRPEELIEFGKLYLVLFLSPCPLLTHSPVRRMGTVLPFFFHGIQPHCFKNFDSPVERLFLYETKTANTFTQQNGTTC